MYFKEECAVCLGSIDKVEVKYFDCCRLNVCFDCIQAKWTDNSSSLFKKGNKLQCPV